MRSSKYLIVFIKKQKINRKAQNMLSFNILKCLLVLFAPYGLKIDCLILTKLFIIVKIYLNANLKDLISFLEAATGGVL